MYLFKKARQRVEHLIEYASYLFLGVSGVLILLISFAATYGVIRRYVFNNPEPYSYEIGIIFLLFSFVLTVAELQKRERHIHVDMIITHLPEVTQYILRNIVGPIVGLFLCVMLTWQSWDNAWFALQIGEVSPSVWKEPLFPIKILVPIGYGLLCLILLIKLYHGIVSLKTAQRR